MRESVANTIENLKKNGFQARYFETSLEAKEAILKSIPKEAAVGIGGSMTIYDMGLQEDLKLRGSQVYWHWLVEPEERNEVMSQASRAPVYLSSSNAITEDGKLVNMDGIGNRVASIFYGHEKVYILAGVNKITKDVASGIDRIKKIASPKNTKRLKLDTPCRHTGLCHDCQSKDRICNVAVILDHMPMKGDIMVYLINEDLGY